MKAPKTLINKKLVRTGDTNMVKQQQAELVPKHHTSRKAGAEGSVVLETDVFVLPTSCPTSEVVCHRAHLMRKALTVFLSLLQGAKLAGDRVHVHYQVKEVQITDEEKTVFLEGSYSQEAVVLHLQNGWFDTPVQAGHHLNLIADKTRDASGVLHAVCNFDTGAAPLLCHVNKTRSDQGHWILCSNHGRVGVTTCS